ncbi:hypothetical protein ACIGFK_29475 [Streptomyces sp. NPDC085524]|uniref:hypothetical protein n=1 Tax=unclassified Streptomyces TaxID=2593676 RepID=UPI0036B25231
MAGMAAAVLAGCGSAPGAGGGAGGAGPTPSAPPSLSSASPGGQPTAAATGDTEKITCYAKDGSVAGHVQLDRADPGAPVADAEKQKLCAAKGWSATR